MSCSLHVSQRHTRTSRTSRCSFNTTSSDLRVCTERSQEKVSPKIIAMLHDVRKPTTLRPVVPQHPRLCPWPVPGWPGVRKHARNCFFTSSEDVERSHVCIRSRLFLDFTCVARTDCHLKLQTLILPTLRWRNAK